MEALSRYIDVDNRGCPDHNNMRSAVLVGVYSVRDPTLARIALFIRQNRAALGVHDSNISERTLRYMTLCLQRYGIIAKLSNETYEICSMHEKNIADIVSRMTFSALDDTPVEDTVDAVLASARAAEVDTALTMVQSVYYGVAPVAPSNVTYVDVSPDAPVETAAVTPTPAPGRYRCIIS